MAGGNFEILNTGPAHRMRRERFVFRTLFFCAKISYPCANEKGEYYGRYIFWFL